MSNLFDEVRCIPDGWHRRFESHFELRDCVQGTPNLVPIVDVNGSAKRIEAPWCRIGLENRVSFS